MSRFDGTSKDPIARQLVEIAFKYLSAADKVRDAAAHFIAHFVTRPDLVKSYLPALFEKSLTSLTEEAGKERPNVNLILGVLSAVAMIFKHGKRTELEGHAEQIYTTVKNLGLEESKNMLVRKLVCKLYTRVCLVHLKTKSASWHYKKGARSLLTTLSSTTESFSAENYSNESILAPNGNAGDPGADDSDDIEVKEDVEAVLNDLLMTFIKDSDTVVRWSAAKGIGRVTARLPLDLANDIIDTILGYFSSLESECTWHGCCLALAELGRRGLFLPVRLPEVIAVMSRSFQYDEQRGFSSVGANVRDAACYLAWSLPRTFDKTVLSSHVSEIASSLILVVLFDREINCRRAASAAYQENVGRHGKLPDGIEILTITDYHAVGNRTNCYTNLACQISKYEAYCQPIIDHLVERRVIHWDGTVRLLAAEALGILASDNVEYMAQVVLPIVIMKLTRNELAYRHGSILAASYILLSLHKVQFSVHSLSQSMKDELTNLVPNLEAKNFLKGVGGEAIKPAVCLFIGKLSETGFYQDLSIINKTFNFLLECVKYNKEDVQVAAYEAMGHFYMHTHQLCPDLKPRIIEQINDGVKSMADFEKSGCASLAGSMPGIFYSTKNAMAATGSLTECIGNTITNSVYAKSRVSCVQSIGKIFILFAEQGNLEPQFAEQSFEGIFLGLKDYTNDDRGDIGAIVREACVNAFCECICSTDSKTQQKLPRTLLHKCLSEVMSQTGSRINSVREAAFVCLRKFYNKDYLHLFPQSDQLKSLIAPFAIKTEVEGEELSYRSAVMFNHLYPFLDLEQYSYNVLMGLLSCLGGLTETLSNDALQALSSYAQSIADIPEKCDRLLQNFLLILRNNQNTDRVVMPYLKSAAILLQSGFFDTLGSYNSGFSNDMLELLRLLTRTTIYQKLQLLANVFSAFLLSQDSKIHEPCLRNLLVFLGHKYPKLRKHTADQLFEAILISPELVAHLPDENQEEINNLLEQYDWTQIDTKTARETRNTVSALFKLEPPKKAGTLSAAP